MANANAVKIRSTKKNANGKPKYPKPSGVNLAHNSAVNKANYWLNDGGKIIQSQSYNNTHEVNADWIKWENEARERYKNNPNNQRAIKSNAVLLEEGLIIIGTDVNAKEKDIEKIVKDFVAKFEKDNNTKVRHWAYHNHEGHEEDGKEHINRHVHFIFDNVDNNGTMVRRNWKRDYFKQMQTDIFDISKKYIKNIERAKESEYEEVEIEDRIVKVNTRKQIHHRVFRNMKENEQIADLKEEKTILKKEITNLKSQNTKSKNEKEKLKEEKKALEKQLKEANNQLRTFMKDNGAVRTDYAELEKEKKILEEKLKAKELTEKELLEKFQKLEENFKTTLAQKDKFLGNLQEIGKEISKETPIKTISEIPEAVKTVLTQNKSLEEQKEVLASKVIELEQKTAPEPNMSDYEDIKYELEDNKENIKVFENHYNLPKTGNLIKLLNWVDSKLKEFSKLLRKKDAEIKELKEEIKELREAKKESLNIVSNLQSEAKRDIDDTRENDSSLLQKNEKSQPSRRLK